VRTGSDWSSGNEISTILYWVNIISHILYDECVVYMVNMSPINMSVRLLGLYFPPNSPSAYIPMSATTLACYIVGPRIDYCNSVLLCTTVAVPAIGEGVGCPPKPPCQKIGAPLVGNFKLYI